MDRRNDEKRLSAPAFAKRHVSPRRPARNLARLVRLVAIFVIVLACFATAIIHVDRVRALALKSQPTTFPRDLSVEGDVLAPPERTVRLDNGTHIDDRYAFLRQLGQGMEGSAGQYLDVHNGDVVVIKIFTGQSRNNIPPALASEFARFTSQWPAEIEAALLFARTPGFVELRDYFIVRHTEATNHKSTWAWAMVSPFVTGGTLARLASDARAAHQSPDDIDAAFRPAFEKFVASLGELHHAELCHDDMKPDNIFVDSDGNWLIGDLGNVREVGHPWHNTHAWRNGYNGPSDCQIHDTLRAVKSYISFLRVTCLDRREFDRAFFGRTEPWSRLYWTVAENYSLTENVLDISAMVPASANTTTPQEMPLNDSPGRAARVDWSWAMNRAAESELACTAAIRRCMIWNNYE